MSDGITLSGVSATIEATERGYMVWVRDAAGRLSAAVDEAYRAARIFVDSVNTAG